MPHRPTTTLGTAASMSISVPTEVRIAGGASSLRKRPIAIESGAESSIAPNDVTSVPTIRSRAPNRSSGAFQTSCQRKPSLKRRIAGQAPSATRQTIAATTSSASSVASAVSPWRSRSPRRSPSPRLRGSAARAVSVPASTPASFQRHGRARHAVTTSSHDVHIACTQDEPARRNTGGVTAASMVSAPAPPAPAPHDDAVFDLRGVTVRYGRATALADVSLAIRGYSITALIGPSGCGKSTVLRCLNRLNDLVPGARVEGEVLYHGVDLYGPRVDPIEVRRRIGMVFQRPNPFPKSIYDNVAYGLRVLGMKDDLDGRVERALRGAALWDEVKDRLKKSALRLSGGQQQRLCIARAIAVEPDVVLLDEPASALDPISTSAIEDLMHELKRDYTLVIVTHNMQQAARVAEMTAFFTLEVDADGSRHFFLVDSATTEKIFTQPADERTEGYVTGRFG